MGRFLVNVSIVSGTGIGGVYPFVVVCFDGDIAGELHKTDATTGAPTCTWNSVCQLDLATLIKQRVAEGKPEPTYLTFFIFDTGAPGVPSLGSAGVLLSTVRDNGIAQGDFQVLNGAGTLALVVSSDKYRDPTQEGQPWYQTNAAKIAAGTGVAALAAGLTAVAVSQHKKKKKKKKAAGAVAAAGGTRDVEGEGEGEGDENGDDEETEDRAVARPWYDPETSSSSSSSDEEEGDDGNDEGDGDENGAEDKYQTYEGGDDGDGDGDGDED